MKIGVGSKNKAKLKAVEQTCEQLFIKASVVAIPSPSNVSNMPFSDEETIEGAINRAKYCLSTTDVDVAFGLEGGVVDTPFGLFLCNWGALAEKGKPTFIAGGARILLPEQIAQRLRAGEELGLLMDEYSKKNDVRSNEGAIGIFTDGLVQRADMLSHIVKLLIGQRNKRGDGTE